MPPAERGHQRAAADERPGARAHAAGDAAQGSRSPSHAPSASATQTAPAAAAAPSTEMTTPRPENNPPRPPTLQMQHKPRAKVRLGRCVRLRTANRSRSGAQQPPESPEALMKSAVSQAYRQQTRQTRRRERRAPEGPSALLHFVLDLRALREALVPLALDCAVVDEHILAPVVRRDEAIALVVAEPLDRPGCHLYTSLDCITNVQRKAQAKTGTRSHSTVVADDTSSTRTKASAPNVVLETELREEISRTQAL